MFPLSCWLVTMLFSVIDWNIMNSQHMLHCMLLFEELLNDHVTLVLKLKLKKLVITGASCNLGWCWWFAVQDVGYGNEGHSFLCSKLFKTLSGACNGYNISKLKEYCISSYHKRVWHGSENSDKEVWSILLKLSFAEGEVYSTWKAESLARLALPWK